MHPLGLFKRALPGALAVVSLAAVASPAHGAVPASHFREVAQLPLSMAPDLPNQGGTGWLIVNPQTRRGYQLVEHAISSYTILQSFDLDTLAPLRHLVLRGVPLPGGVASAYRFAAYGSDVVHAVDEERGRIYLPMSDHVSQTFTPTGPEKARRPVSRFLIIDEAALDRGDPAFAAAFSTPLSHTFLRAHPLMGMAMDSDGPTPSALLLAFAAPIADAVPGTMVRPESTRAVYDHWLVRWNAERVTFSPGATTALVPTALDSTGAHAHLLRACGLGPMVQGWGHYQWGLLSTPDGVWLACHDQAGALAVQVHRAPEGSFQEEESAHPAGPRVGDILVDKGAGRLVGRRVEWEGTHMTVFDTRTASTGTPLKLMDATSLVAMGMDPTTGRLYVHGPDEDFAGNPLPGGGLGFVDTRAEAPAVVMVRPDLASEAAFRIMVDPPTRRFFARRGLFSQAEPFYRVFLDKAA